LRLLGDRGFVPYRIRNEYSLVSYLDVRRPQAPRRFTGPLVDRIDLVFSRTDAAVLS
jgi:hypothetical protein